MKALERHRRMTETWASDPGFKGWFSTVSHTDLGRMFLVTAFFFFLVGGILAMLIRAQLATPHSAFAGPEIYNQLFTMHGTIMMFLFAIPTFEGLAVYLLPKMLGTRDLAFPRLTAYGYWCYVFGGSMLLFSMLFGIAPDGGWFMYPPLTGPLYSPGINTDFWLIGITFVEISAIAAAAEITVSILKYRAPGMSLDKMPIFAWYALVTALMILTGFPPLILGSVLLEVERAFGLPFFQAELGGDSLLWQHLFWLFGHPEVYIIFLPAAGVISTVLPVMCRTTLLGYGWIVAAAVALAFLSFGLWVHHMFTTGIPHMGLAFFSAASTLVAVPTGVQIFAWIGTMWKGRPDLRLPMLHILGFFITFVIGGLTGVMVAVVPFDWQAHDTAFVTAHLHYVLFGGFVFPILAGLYYWLPHFTGRLRFFRLGELAFVLIFVGFHVTFLAMHWVGLLGQRRRISTYQPEDGWTVINLISSIGGFVVALGIGIVIIEVILHAVAARRSARNPWGAGSLEWAMLTPAPAYNFASLPHVTSRNPLADNPDLAVELAQGKGYLAAPSRWRETLTVEVASGKPDYHVIYPGNTRLPIVMSAVTGIFFLSLLVKFYWTVPVAVIGVAVLAWRWVWELGRKDDLPAQSIGHDVELPNTVAVDHAPGWWGSLFLLTANATFFGSLIFGFAFLWTVAPGWPPPVWFEPSAIELGLGILGGLVAVVAMRLALRANDRARSPLPMLGVAFAGTLAVAAACGLLMLRTPAPAEHAYGATLLVMGGYGLFHAALVSLMVVFLIARVSRGFTSPVRRAEFPIVVLWTDYLALVGAFTLLAAHLTGYLA
ncbi:cytochrome c oxidase subunit I+III [Palleronia marisminoris]|uniref:cytochrome-c oxidase n=1 Tax=Palleronia marisminoris TaxID=315423 RepID=A0A1Y5SBC1_9RHOB|nr:cytochrome c oxidase subunit I [Palleronia marisminoris]SFG66636.1 cytochrome c oxidase subunit I+III [Palleronia marisminoris]SLN34125.1 Cytochrome c oxidase subunit 1 [Palleronia marisminoris]